MLLRGSQILSLYWMFFESHPCCFPYFQSLNPFPLLFPFESFMLVLTCVDVGVGTGGLPKIQAFHVTDIVHLLSPTLWASQLDSPESRSGLGRGLGRWLESLSIFEPNAWRFSSFLWQSLRSRACYLEVCRPRKRSTLCEKRLGTSWNQQRFAPNISKPSSIVICLECLKYCKPTWNPNRSWKGFGS